MRGFVSICLLGAGGVVALACAGEQGPQQASPSQIADHPWLAHRDDDGPPVQGLTDLVRPPAGFERVTVPEGSFAAWLRTLPVRLDRQSVRSFRGTEVDAPAAAVFALDLGRGDLQQCADTIIRLHAEYLWASGRADEAAYHFTSGDRSAWPDWVRGERFEVSGNRVRRRMGSARSDDYPTYRSWLQYIFQYAGTLSMKFDSDPVDVVHPGDFFVLPGSPGHTVIVLDVAADERGRRVALIGQGYTPAQDFHLLGAPWPEVLDGVWFPLPDDADEVLRVPGWRSFPRTSARRFGGDVRP